MERLRDMHAIRLGKGEGQGQAGGHIGYVISRDMSGSNRWQDRQGIGEK